MRIIAATLLGVFAGCTWSHTEIGDPVPETHALETGVTSKAEVLRLLGPPQIVRRQFDGELLTWRHVESTRRALSILPIALPLLSLSNTELRRDDVTLLFDQEGTLQAIGVRIETAEEKNE